MNIKTFVVNLDRDRERWNHVSSLLSNIGLEYERVPAVYGRDLTPAQKAIHYDPVGASWRQARMLTASEIGCALSHLMIYREISRRGLPRALILEDDVELEPEIPVVLEALAEHMPEGSRRVCLLSTAKSRSGVEGTLLGEGRWLRPFEEGYFASSYIVTRAAAELLLGHLHPVADVADCWHRLSRGGDLEFMMVDPAVSQQAQEEFGSSTTDDITRLLGGSRFARQRYKMTRLRNVLLGGMVEARRRAAVQPVTADHPHPIDELRC